MAPNRKSQKPMRNGRQGAGRGVRAASRSSSPRRPVRLAGGRRAPRLPKGLRTTLNQHAAKSLRSARASGVRVSGSFPRIVRIPRLRAVAPDCWPRGQAQRLVPVSWFTDRWTPLVRVRRARTHRLPLLRLPVTFKYPQSLTTL